MKKILFLLSMVAFSNIGYAQKDKSASELLTGFLSSVGAKSPKETAAYFSEEGSIEIPYATILGLLDNVVGPEKIEELIANLLNTAPNFHIKNIQIIMEEPNAVLAEYESEATLTNGRTYSQHYIGYLFAENGKIVKHREFMNTVPFAQSFFLNGLQDLITK